MTNREKTVANENGLLVQSFFYAMLFEKLVSIFKIMLRIIILSFW